MNATMALASPGVDHLRGIRTGRVILGAALVAFIAAGLPIVSRGAPLADDFTNCLGPQRLGLAGFLAESWDRLGMVRLARFPEIFLTTGVCRALPFGVAIAVPMVLTMTVAFLVRGLLRDVGAGEPWADAGAAAWLLQPLGTEAALWPAALHVPLGLALALVALRCHQRGRHGSAALAAAGAAMCVEQVILALPLAAWAVAPREERWRAAVTAGVVSAAALVVFSLWPGADPRLQVAPSARAAALVNDPLFYVAFPAVGLGLHSIPLAVGWALPWSLMVLAAGAAGGAVAAGRMSRADGFERGVSWSGTLVAAALVLLVNLPVMLSVPHQGSPRVFAPTWLVLVVAIALWASATTWRRPRLFGAAAGALGAGAVLSMALSVSVRLASADFVERSSRVLAETLPDNADVAVCGVRRTVTSPAPRGAFAVHELLYDWGARGALIYYTGRRATFHLAGEPWNRPCPSASEVDAVVQFDDLLARTRP